MQGRTARTLPSGTVTFLLTDIEGSTKRWEKHKGCMADVVGRHDEIVIQVVEEHDGIDLRKKGEGDSHFAVFDSASKAVLAAADIQRALSAEDWSEVDPIKVRIAIHTGEAQVRNDDYYGQAVNRCARLRSVAHGGQTIVSESTRRLAGTLPDSLSLKDLGQHRLKDLLEPERIYQLNSVDLEADFPPLASLSAAKHNLPVQLTSFVGRTKQIEKIKRLIYRSRLVTLTGAGGTGKTRLGLQVGADVLDEFPDGVWFVSLVEIQDPALVPQAIARALPAVSPHGDPLESIIAQYHDARALFVIDNCEHVVKGAAATLHDVLRKCPSVVALATSREQLGVSGENVFNVPTMTCDVNVKNPGLDEVANLESVQLFIARAASRLSGENILTPKTAATVAAICKMLDGIPLAIEQAAASLSFMSLEELRASLEQHFGPFGPPDIVVEVGVDERHRTMQAAIDWSYGMLSEDEKHLFANLSIFQGGWSAKSCAVICADNQVPYSSVLPVLRKLVLRSLILSESKEGLPETRFRMLEPIRQFAEAKRSDAPGLLERYFDFFYSFVKDAAEAGLEADRGRHYRALTEDYDNVRSALRYAASDEGNTYKLLELSVALYPFWFARDLFREGISWLQRAMEGCPRAPESLRAEALLNLGVLSWASSMFDAAEQAMLAAFESYRSLEDSPGMTKVRGNLANLFFSAGEFPRAAEEYAEVAKAFRELGDLERLCPTLENWGVTESNLGNLEKAQSLLEEAVAIRRSLGHTAALAKAIDSLLGVYALRGALMRHLALFIEASGLALAVDVELLRENLLELGMEVCLDLEMYQLAAEAHGAIEKSVEDSGRLIPESIRVSRGRLFSRIASAIEMKALRKAVREGRATGTTKVLTTIHERLTRTEECQN